MNCLTNTLIGPCSIGCGCLHAGAGDGAVYPCLSCGLHHESNPDVVLSGHLVVEFRVITIS